MPKALPLLVVRHGAGFRESFSFPAGSRVVTSAEISAKNSG